MALLIAGLRGGLIEDPSRKGPATSVLNLLSGRLDSAGLRSFLREPQPRNLTAVVNNSCNLKCRHCYLQVDELSAEPLTVQEWERVTASICNSNFQLVCLSGKEVFLGSTGPAVLSMMSAARKEQRGFFRLGVITNGTLLEPHRQRLIGSELSYMDISLDGLKDAHDSIRGAGTYDRVAKTMEWVGPAFGARVFAMTTLLTENFRQVPEVAQGLHRLGFQNIGFGFYRPQTYTDSSLIIDREDSVSVFDGLDELAHIQIEQPLTVLFDMDCHMLDQLIPFLNSKWFDPANLKVDRMGDVFVSHQLNNGVALKFRFSPYPTGIWRSARLNPDGNFLAAEDTVNAKLYNQRSLGNIRDFDYDIEALNEHASKSERVQQILEDYESRILPMLVSAASSRLASLRHVEASVA